MHSIHPRAADRCGNDDARVARGQQSNCPATAFPRHPAPLHRSSAGVLKASAWLASIALLASANPASHSAPAVKATPAPAVKATPAPEKAPRKAAVQKKDAAAKKDVPADLPKLGGDLFAQTPTQPITLQQAIEMALQNNLEAKFERVGINIQRSQLRFAAGAFDPVFTMSVQHQSTRILENVNSPSSAQEAQTQQALELQLNQSAIQLNADTLGVEQQALANANQLNAQLQQQQLAQVNFQRALQGQAPVTLGGLVTPATSLITPQIITQPNLNQFVTLDQQNTQGTATLEARSPYGTRYQFQASVNRFRDTYSGDPSPLDPLYQNFVGVTIQQPLLKNFGKDANLSDLRVAELNKRIQTLNWKQNVTTAVQGVMSTYYDMLYELEDMHVREDAIAADTKLVELYRRRLDLGFSTPLDVQQAEVAVSTDREALLTSKNGFLERQFALKRLILKEYQAKDPRIFMPASAPQLIAPGLNRTDLMSTAFTHRYDYQATVLGTKIQDVRLKFAKNQLLPELDLVATYGFNGLDESFSRSDNQIFGGATPQWTVGMNFQIPLGNRQAKGQYAAANSQKEQAILRMKESELTVSVDVETVMSRIETNRQRVDTSRKTRELGEEAVRISYRRLDEGLISAFDVIDQQRKLYDAKSREIAAIAELNKSVTQLWLVTGTVLERQGITFEETHDELKITPVGVFIHEKK